MIEIRYRLQVFLFLIVIGVTVYKPSVRLMLPNLSFLHRTLLLANKRPTSSLSPYPFHTLKTDSAEHINLSINSSLVAHNGTIREYHPQPFCMISDSLYRFMRFSH